MAIMGGGTKICDISSAAHAWAWLKTAKNSSVSFALRIMAKTGVPGATAPFRV
jgi:hypothetical protein